MQTPRSPDHVADEEEAADAVEEVSKAAAVTCVVTSSALVWEFGALVLEGITGSAGTGSAARSGRRCGRGGQDVVGDFGSGARDRRDAAVPSGRCSRALRLP